MRGGGCGRGGRGVTTALWEDTAPTAKVAAPAANDAAACAPDVALAAAA